MFEVTIRTDNPLALQQLAEFLASLNFEVFGKAYSAVAPVEKKKPEPAVQFTFQSPERKAPNLTSVGTVKAPPAEITATNNGSRVRQAGWGKDIFLYVAPDFDATPEGFEEYMPAA